MKRLVIIVAVVVGLVVGTLVAVPYFFKDKIVALVKATANEQLTATVDFDNLDLSLLRSFPQASVRLENLRVVNQAAPFAGDTLVACAALDMTVNPLAYWREQKIAILALTLDKPVLNLRIAADSSKNWKITKPNPDERPSTKPSTTKISLTTYTVNDGTVRFRKDAAERELLLTQFNHEGRGDFAKDVFTLMTQSSAVMSFTNGGVTYVSEAPVTLKMDVAMDLNQMKFTFAENELRLRELLAQFEGYFAMPDGTDDMEFDIRFATKNNEFKNLLSLVPAVYSSTVSDLKSSGTATIQGFVKGIYNDSTYPGFDITVQAANGSFQYPKLPKAVNNVFLDMRVTNPGGQGFDSVVLMVKNLALTMAGDPFKMNLELRRPISDPFVDVNLQGRVNLENVKSLLPPEKLEGKQISGIVAADVHFKGAKSAVENKLFSAIEASGQVSTERFSFASAALPETIAIEQALLTLNPKNATLKHCAVKLGASDVALAGTLDNVLGYVMNAPADSVLKGSLTLASTYFDCNPWLKDSTQKAAPKSSTPDTVATAVELPGNVDFTFAAAMKSVQYTNLSLADVQGKMTLRDKTLRFENVGLKAFGGSVVMNGLYDSRSKDAPHTRFDLKVTALDIGRTFGAFSSLKAIAPFTDHLKGIFSASIALETDLDGKLKPVWQSFNSNGGMTVSPLKFEGFSPLNQVADLLKLDFLRDPTILKVNPYYEIKNGRLYVKPLSMKIGGYDVMVSGSNGLDKSIDYVLTVNLPMNKIPTGTLAAVPVLGDMVEKAKSRPIPLNINITGTFDNPVITPSVAGASVQDAATQVLDAVQEEAKRRAQEEVEKAKQQLQAEAEKKAKELEQKAKEEAEKKAKEALKDKAPSLLKNIFGGSREAPKDMPKDTSKH
jgi:hypothetical protein